MNKAAEICAFIQTNLVDSSVVFDKDTSFDKLGLDSFSIVEIILFIERRYGISLRDKDLTKDNLFSASALANCIERNQIKQ